MTDREHITLDADELKLFKSGLIMTSTEFMALSQSELDFLKLVQKAGFENTARLTSPAGAQVRERTLKDVVE